MKIETNYFQVVIPISQLFRFGPMNPGYQI